MTSILDNGIYILRNGGIRTLNNDILTIDDNGYFQIAAQTGTSDNISTITYSVTGITAAALVILRADVGDTITIKHGVGNIYLNSTVDFALSGNKTIMLVFDGTSWMDIGATVAASGGTVTSVGLSVPSILSVSGTPVTTSGTIAITLSDQTENTVFAGPVTAPAATPVFRALIESDIPDLAASKITSSTIAHERGGFEADVSAYTGVPRINGGVTSDIGIGTTVQFLRGDYAWEIPPIGNFICIVDEKTVGTDGGTFTSGAWRTRNLNVIRANTGGYATLASNQITLAAGTYRCYASAPAFAVDRHQCRLYNVTNATQLVTGQSSLAYSTYLESNISVLFGRFVLAASSVIELQHRCQTTVVTQGFGIAAVFGTEVYSQVMLWRE